MCACQTAGPLKSWEMQHFHPFPGQILWLQSSDKMYFPVLSLYKTAKSRKKKKKLRRDQSNFGGKNQGERAEGPNVFLPCCLWCQFDPFNPYLSPLISHTSRKRSILPALACCLFSSFPSSSCWFDFHVLFIWSALRFFTEPLTLRSLLLPLDRLALQARLIFKV